MKKVLTYSLIVIFVLICLGGVYLFITKGYSNKKISLDSIKNAINPTPVASQKDESGNVKSTTIPLTVTYPEDGMNLGTTNVVVTGKTLPNAEVFVNDQETKADSLGNFSVSIGLDEGENQIVVNANDKNGNVAEEDININISTFN